MFDQKGLLSRSSLSTLSVASEKRSGACFAVAD
jgi:hypothetical protein